jgi:hypothetical protein
LYLFSGGLLLVGYVWDFWFLNEQCSTRNVELTRNAQVMPRSVAL